MSMFWTLFLLTIINIYTIMNQLLLVGCGLHTFQTRKNDSLPNTT